jgi:hypothetical protein
MFVEKGSPFLEPLNWIVYRAVEAGLIQKYYADSRYSWRIQGLSNMSDSGGEDSSDGGYVAFSLSHLKVTFIILVSGLCFSLLVLILEIVHFRFLSGMHGF